MALERGKGERLSSDVRARKSLGCNEYTFKGDSQKERRAVEKDSIFLENAQVTMYVGRNMGRNMGSKGHSDEVSDRNGEYVIG